MTIEEILSKYNDIDLKNFSVSTIASEIKSLPDEYVGVFNIMAEGLAFSFVENTKQEDWNTYFGPMWVAKDKDDNLIELPSIISVTKDVIEYWEKRIDECTNPILKVRYAGLVWDFKEKQTGVKPDVKILFQYIEALIQCVEGDYLEYPIDGLNKIIRAIILVKNTKNIEVLDRAKNALFNYEDLKSTDLTPGLWGQAFLLMLNRGKIFTIEEENLLVKKMEDRLDRLKLMPINGESQNKLDPWVIKDVAELLAQYYRKKNDISRIRLILHEVELAYDKLIDSVSSLQAVGWLNDVHKLYTAYGLLGDAKALLPRIREKGKSILAEMMKTEASAEITQEQINEYVEFMLQGSIDEIFERFTFKYIPDKDNAKSQVLEQAKGAPLYYMIPHQLFDEKGRMKSVVDNIDNDIEGHIILQISLGLNISHFFMRSVISRAVESGVFNNESILNFLHKSPIIEDDRFGLINHGLEAYFSNNYISFIHIIIPQIENAIRNLIELSGGTSLKPAKNGKGFQLRTFDDILRDTIIESSLGEDFANYMRILFTDQRGWNIRNEVCHGIASEGMFNQMVADRVLHALLCMGVIRWDK